MRRDLGQEKSLLHLDEAHSQYFAIGDGADRYLCIPVDLTCNFDWTLSTYCVEKRVVF